MKTSREDYFTKKSNNQRTNFDYSDRVVKKAPSVISVTSEIDVIMMKINDGYDTIASKIVSYIRGNNVSAADVQDTVSRFISNLDEHTQLEIMKRIIMHLV